MLEIKNLSVKYDGLEVVHGISMHANKGELIALIGANGVGKTSILKTLSGLHPAAGGQILYDNQDITNLPSHKIVGAGIVHVPEGRQVFPRMSVLENIKLGAYIQKDKVQNKENTERMWSIFPILYERRHQSAGTLSGGEQQMLAMARALMSNPRLLLLDEPSMGLSPIKTEQIFDVIRTLRQEGMTILLVEQNAFEALDVSDRTYVLETGVITQEGESAALKDDPAIKRAYLGGD